MQITRNVYTINDLNNWYESKELIINKDYQREGGIWVPNARSYLIDTILNGFPFPKVTLRQIINLKSRKTIREIVDGQQRIKTINSYINDGFELTKASENFSGLLFSELSEEFQEAILSYEVSIDLVISATEEEVLEIFRRMNSYTLPLNPAEQRHATYQGNFKWFIKRLLKDFTPFLLQFKVFTPKSISRMADAEFFTEIAQIKLFGITNKSQTRLDQLYRKYDESFSEDEEIFEEIHDAMSFLKNELYEASETGLLKPYILYSLLAALLFNKYGFPIREDSELGEFEVVERFTNNVHAAQDNVLILLSAFDTKDILGPYKEFVRACLAATNNSNNRITRTKWFINALNDEL